MHLSKLIELTPKRVNFTLRKLCLKNISVPKIQGMNIQRKIKRNKVLASGREGVSKGFREDTGEETQVLC